MSADNPYLPMTRHPMDGDWRGVTHDGNMVIVTAEMFAAEAAHAVPAVPAGFIGYYDPYWWIHYRPTLCRVVSAGHTAPLPVREQRLPLRAVLCLFRHRWSDARVQDTYAATGLICRNCGKDYPIE